MHGLDCKIYSYKNKTTLHLMLVNHYHCIGVVDVGCFVVFRWLSMFLCFVFSRGQFLELRFLKERLVLDTLI